ncbi:MAG: PASTA domain-containing protein, partial [Pseudonocardiaceae bacterium]
LEDRIGSIDPVVEMAWRLGMRESLSARDGQGRTLRDAIKQDRRGSYTLGPEPTSPLDLANVGATLMSAGTWCPPTPIDAMYDRNGNPVLVPEAPCEQAVPEGLANTLAVGLSKDDQPGGTSFQAARSANWTRPMLGKTGTTQNNRSAGFIGATPQYSAAALVWPDGARPRPICDSDPPQLCSNGNIFGGKVPARTWYKAMVPLHEGLPVLPLPPPEERFVAGGGVRLPNVVGQGENQARLTLERAGFKVATVTSSSGQPVGTVVAQSPPDRAMPGELVTLSISDGTPRRTPTERPTTRPGPVTEEPTPIGPQEPIPTPEPTEPPDTEPPDTEPPPQPEPPEPPEPPQPPEPGTA